MGDQGFRIDEGVDELGRRLQQLGERLDDSLAGAPERVDGGIASEALGAIMAMAAQVSGTAAQEASSYGALVARGWSAYREVEESVDDAFRSGLAP